MSRNDNRKRKKLPYEVRRDMLPAAVYAAGPGAVFAHRSMPGGWVQFDFIRMRPLIAAVRSALGLPVSGAQ